jgi:polyhydroxybutyrate depolymerase
LKFLRPWLLFLAGACAGRSPATADGPAGAHDAPAAALPPDPLEVDAASEGIPASDAAGEVAPGGSAGCGRQGVGGEATVTVGGAQSTYLVLPPRRYDPARPYPLVFYLHGRGDHPETAPEHSADVAAALADRAILVYPRALSSGWEEKEGPHTEMLRLIRQQVSDRFCVDPTRFVVVGFSSGGWFTSMIACSMADELAGVVIASAGLKRRCSGRKPALVIAAIGEPDFGAARGAADYFRSRNGCAATTTASGIGPCTSYEGCPPALPVSFCPWTGTHLWPTAFGGSAVADFLSHLRP